MKFPKQSDFFSSTTVSFSFNSILLSHGHVYSCVSLIHVPLVLVYIWCTVGIVKYGSVEYDS